MDNLTAGNPRAHAVRVYYSGTSTIYEGMPVCYNYDTDTNWFGGSVSDGAVTATTTTADGSQNERRYIEVENPADNNLMSFAGVVKRGGWCGKTGPRVLDIYVPNGAIVPVRCDVDTTEGVTILAITVASQELGRPVDGTSRPVAIAAETETGLGSTADITLATLDPNRFVYQNLDGTALSTGAGTDNIVVNEIKYTTAQTSGNFCALRVESASTAGAGSNGYGASLYVQGDLTGVAAAHWNPFGCWANITGGTQSGTHLTVAEFGIYASGANLAAVSSLSCITLRNQVSSTNPPNAVHNVIRVVQDGGGDSADFLFSFHTPDTVSMVSCTDTADYGIPIHIESSSSDPAAGTYYIMVCSSTS